MSAERDFEAFALSIDTINDVALERCREFVKDIVRRGYDVTYFEARVDGERIDNEPALRTMWLLEDGPRVTDPVFRDGDISGLRSFAYVHDVCLWVTSDGGFLRDAGTEFRTAIFNDAKQHVEEALNKGLEKGWRYEASSQETKTAVLLPLRFGAERNRVFGVLALEFGRNIEKNEVAKERLTTLARAISRIIWLSETVSEQQNGTLRVLDELSRRYSTRIIPGGLDQGSVFFAYPSRAGSEVVGTVQDIFSECCGGFWKLEMWSSDYTLGSISSHIVSQISRSSRGICYLSEVTGADTPRYRDNPNVLFEAGMLHAMFKSAENNPRYWLPIREDHNAAGITDPIPFDFAGDKVLLVPRDQDGTLKQEAFKDRLRKYLAELTR